jgi:integrase
MVPLGPHSKNRTKGFLTLEEARANARDHCSSAVNVDRDRPTDGRPGKASHEAVAQAQTTTSPPSRPVEPPGSNPVASGTLADLCRTYITVLKAAGKHHSVQDCESYFRRHIEPTEYASVAAGDLTPDQAAKLIRKVRETGKKCTAKHLRSFLHAAYAKACNANLDTEAPAALIAFGIISNPISKVPAARDKGVQRKRNLSVPELTGLWRYLHPADESLLTVEMRVVRFDLLLGGQRCEQLMRVKTNEVDTDADTIQLYDPKGNRDEPRPHLLPMSPPAKRDALWFLQHSQLLGSEFLFAGRCQGRSLHPNTVSKAVVKISDALLKSKAITSRFGYADLRRTAETRMAQLGVAPHIRAHIQSHDLGGIQITHYDMWEYLPQKHDALAQWARFLSTLLVRPGKSEQRKSTASNREIAMP